MISYKNEVQCSVRPKPGCGIGNRNQDHVSVQWQWYFELFKSDFDNIPNIYPMCMKCRPACTDSANRLLWRDSATKRQVWESALKLPTRLCGSLHLELKPSELDLQSTQHQKRSIRRFCSLRNLLNWLVNQVRSWKYTVNNQMYILITHQSLYFVSS